jgi:AbrB family looped-hinge helix DNA binding protein
MPVIKLGKRRQVVLPFEVCRELGIDEGEYLEVGVKNGTIVMKPKVLIDKAQSLNQELACLNQTRPVKEVAEKELEAMTEKAKQRVFERYYAKS